MHSSFGSYTKSLFEVMGHSKSGHYTLAEAHSVLRRYILEKLDPGTGAAADSTLSPVRLSGTIDFRDLATYVLRIGGTFPPSS
jgi:hypothetical protein